MARQRLELTTPDGLNLTRRVYDTRLRVAGARLKGRVGPVDGEGETDYGSRGGRVNIGRRRSPTSGRPGALGGPKGRTPCGGESVD